MAGGDGNPRPPYGRQSGLRRSAYAGGRALLTAEHTRDMSLVCGTPLPGAPQTKNARPKMTVRCTLISASGMAKPNGPVHNVSDLACRSRHHSDPLAGLLTPFRRRVLWLFPARRPFFQLSIGSITQKSPNCKGIPAHPPRFSCAYPVRNGHPMRMVVSSVGCSSTSGFSRLSA